MGTGTTWRATASSRAPRAPPSTAIPSTRNRPGARTQPRVDLPAGRRRAHLRRRALPWLYRAHRYSRRLAATVACGHSRQAAASPRRDARLARTWTGDDDWVRAPHQSFRQRLIDRMHVAALDLTHLLSVYGYWAVLVAVGLESTGIPFPGETTLLVAAVYSGTTHRLNIVGVIAAAAAGAILGDNLGFWVGREGGFRLLRRYGTYIRLDERKLKLGQYLFHQPGAKAVFFG